MMKILLKERKKVGAIDGNKERRMCVCVFACVGGRFGEKRKRDREGKQRGLKKKLVLIVETRKRTLLVDLRPILSCMSCCHLINL
jgi:hypothetical protein